MPFIREVWHIYAYVCAHLHSHVPISYARASRLQARHCTDTHTKKTLMHDAYAHRADKHALVGHNDADDQRAYLGDLLQVCKRAHELTHKKGSCAMIMCIAYISTHPLGAMKLTISEQILEICCSPRSPSGRSTWHWDGSLCGYGDGGVLEPTGIWSTRRNCAQT